ncbi:MAG TPA: DnaD domain protein [Ruminococcus sp.]|nr:DnaD domain protein [Ruminococcus sp.]
MEYRINTGLLGNLFAVPGIVADNFLKLATGDQIKVLLYLLRSAGRDISPEEIAANTGVTAAAAEEAVLFWQQANVVAGEGVLPGIMQDAPSRAAEIQAEKPREVITEDKQKAIPQRTPLLAPTEIAQLVKGSKDISELFTIAESALGPLNHTMQNSLITMYTHLGLKKEVILILLNYCKSIDKTNSAYIEKIAYSWAENDINTLESAQDDVERMSLSHDFTGMVMKQFEMKRRPTSGQMVFVDQWREAGFSPEMLRLAYEMTVERIDKVSFPYINSILQSWRDSGYKSVEDVKRSESEFRKNKKKGSGGSSGGVDIDKYKEFINDF